MVTIFHLALVSDWVAAQEAGAYTVSTRGRTLAEEGFIHASRGDQWPKVRDLFYADVAEPLVLLRIDTDRLDVPVIDEPPAPGVGETFPHIYGPLPLDAVVKAIPVPARGSVAPPASTPRAPRADAPQGTFGRFFLTEMIVNMALVVLILLAATAGLGLGSATGGDAAALVGLGAGAIVGGVVARWLYVRRHAR